MKPHNFKLRHRQITCDGATASPTAAVYVSIVYSIDTAQWRRAPSSVIFSTEGRSVCFARQEVLETALWEKNDDHNATGAYYSRQDPAWLPHTRNLDVLDGVRHNPAKYSDWPPRDVDVDVTGLAKNRYEYSDTSSSDLPNACRSLSTTMSAKAEIRDESLGSFRLTLACRHVEADTRSPLQSPVFGLTVSQS